MKSRCNALSIEILSKKYYGPNDKSPEDVFKRVATVCAIPDVIWNLVTGGSVKQIRHNIYDIFPMEYHDLVTLVLQREGIITWEHSGYTEDEIESAKIFYKNRIYSYYDAMCQHDFMAASPTLMNAGLGGMLSSCFYLEVQDSMDDIFQSVKNTALISQAGGGTGLAVSNLRPQGFSVKKSGGTSSGPISFLQVFDETGRTVVQGGRRKAALLGSLRVDHPDIVKFIKAKQKEGILSNFNLSVLVTDDFMDLAHESGEPNLHVTYFDGKTFLISKEDDTYREFTSLVDVEDQANFYTAKDIWDLLVENAYNNGEPGVIFIDTMNSADVLKGEHGSFGVNPCGELCLKHLQSCNLAAINLANCITDGQFDYEKLRYLVQLGVEFLDNVVSLNKYPLPEIAERTLETRKIGLGVMGLHDAMLLLGIEYGTLESLEFIDHVYNSIQDEANCTSIDLGRVRGIPTTLQSYGVLRRNEGLLTCQPTGTISMICNQVSSGIEPVFQWVTKRKDSYGTHEINHWLIDKFYGNVPAYAKTALEIPLEDHVKVQARIQLYIDNSISKTCNARNDCTKKDISDAMFLSYTMGCKSITVYRDGSRKEQVLSKVTTEKKEPEKQMLVATADEPKKAEQKVRGRPRVLFGATFRVNTPVGILYITINEDEQGVREVFINISKVGTEIASHVATEGRLISTGLKYGVPLDEFIDQLKNQKSSPVWDKGKSIKSVPDAVSRILEDYVENFEGFSECLLEYQQDTSSKKTQPIEKSNSKSELSGEICPECGEMLYMESGCCHCKSCGYSMCTG